MNNPDIPVQRAQKNGREVTRDTFYNSMKAPSRARNGDGFALARSGGLPNLNPRQEFMLEGAIDPANIRARHNPSRAPPNSFAQGGEGFQYTPPTAPARNEVDLVKRSRQSYLSRVTRLDPNPTPAPQVSST